MKQTKDLSEAASLSTVQPVKMDPFDFPLTGLLLSRLWPLAQQLCEGNLDEGWAFREERKKHPPRTDTGHL